MGHSGEHCYRTFRENIYLVRGVENRKKWADPRKLGKTVIGAL